MANSSKKNPDNVPGKYYIDSDCSACGVCSDDAPASIRLTNDGAYAYVYKQPSTPEEESALKAALDNCPSESIGNDG